MEDDINMIKPAIVAVGYNRTYEMRRLLESIENAKYKDSDITLIISIDESNKSDEIEKIAKNIKWTHGKKYIRRFSRRQGLQKHIIQCGDYSEKYGAVIILEDDLVVGDDFYIYACEAHKKYSTDDRICGVSLYSHQVNQFSHLEFTPIQSGFDAYLGDMVVTWGQSWTFEQWRKFKNWYFQNENQLPAVNNRIPRDISNWTRSWGRYFATYIVENNLSYIYPYVSRTTCFADYGEHNKSKTPVTFVQVPLMNGCPNSYRFGKYDELVHYDAFYEHVLSYDNLICNIHGSDICMDLNQLKSITLGKKYLITGEKLNYTKIASFGLSLRPISMNVLKNLPGNQLYLYKVDNGGFIRKWGKKRNELKLNLRRLKYEYKDAAWQILLYYAPREFIIRLKDKILEKLKRK